MQAFRGIGAPADRIPVRSLLVYCRRNNTPEEAGMASLFEEFKKFAVKGNVIDLAVALVVGNAFGAVVKSLVDDVLMPPIGLVLGRVDFSNLYVVLNSGAVAGPYATLADATKAGAVTFRYGLFVNSIISFVIVSFAMFLVVRAMLRLKLEEPVTPPPAAVDSDEVKLLREIRDALVSRAD